MGVNGWWFRLENPRELLRDLAGGRPFDPTLEGCREALALDRFEAMAERRMKTRPLP
jgi:hypothetical protein